MKLRLIFLALFVACAAACGTDGAPRYGGDLTDPAAEALARFGSCAVCHQEKGVRIVLTGGHKDLPFTCDVCHSELLADRIGPGHREIPECTNCHPGHGAHVYPSTETEADCADCHNPHGSTNLFLLREQIVTPAGAHRDVVFTNQDGLADGSYASVSEPGTGICETCHLTTQHFRADGTGEEHFALPCPTCHTHESGFTPP